MQLTKSQLLTIVSFATLADGGPNGGFFRDGVQIEW
jgi:hypothetical protein